VFTNDDFFIIIFIRGVNSICDNILIEFCCVQIDAE
jgi:hypothetical protein